MTPTKPKKKKLAPYGYAGGNIRHMIADSPESALRTDIYNALTLSAAAHGDPKIEWTQDEGKNQWVTIHLQSRRVQFCHDYRHIAKVTSGHTEYNNVSLTGDLVYDVAQAWHWDRLINAVMPVQPIQKRFTPRYHPGTGIMSAFRKRARLLSA